MGGGSRAGRGEGSGARSTGTGGICRRRPVGNGKKGGKKGRRDGSGKWGKDSGGRVVDVVYTSM